MFNFGNPKDTAQMLIDDMVRWGGGPGMPEREPKEYDWEEARTALIYASAALRHAYQNGHDEETLYALCQVYEKRLLHYCEFRDHIYNAMRSGDHLYPWPDPAAIARQTHYVQRIYEARHPNEDSRDS